MEDLTPLIAVVILPGVRHLGAVVDVDVATCRMTFTYKVKIIFLILRLLESFWRDERDEKDYF